MSVIKAMICTIYWWYPFSI